MAIFELWRNADLGLKFTLNLTRTAGVSHNPFFYFKHGKIKGQGHPSEVHHDMTQGSKIILPFFSSRFFFGVIPLARAHHSF